jgi:hypothetical protein
LFAFSPPDSKPSKPAFTAKKKELWPCIAKGRRICQFFSVCQKRTEIAAWSNETGPSLLVLLFDPADLSQLAKSVTADGQLTKIEGNLKICPVFDELKKPGRSFYL